MSTSVEKPPPRVAYPVAPLARSIGVSSERVVRWIKAGKLPAFTLPDKDPDRTGRGEKGYRVWGDDWDRFTRSLRLAGPTPEPEIEPFEQPSPRRPAVLAGTDGKRRGRSGRP